MTSRCRIPAAAGRPVRRCWLSGLQTPREFAASAARLGELPEEAGRSRPRLGICLHAAIGARPAAGLPAITAASMQRMFGVPAGRARELAIGGTPAPMERSWELLAETRRLLGQP